MARIAAVMALSSRGPDVRTVNADEATRAARLAELLVEHALIAFGQMHADEVEADAWALLKWITKEHCTQFRRSAAQKALEGRFRTVERLKAACVRLADWNCISAERMERHKGKRPSPVYEVNPALRGAEVFDV
jgi:hypothetical protein